MLCVPVPKPEPPPLLENPLNSLNSQFVQFNRLSHSQRRQLLFPLRLRLYALRLPLIQFRPRQFEIHRRI
jgi:hypothetical protein